MKNNLLKIGHLLGGLLTLSGVILQFLQYQYAQWIFIAGVVLLIIVQLLYMLQTKPDDIRKQRQVGLMFLSTILLGVGAYLMYIGNGYWIVTVLIYGVLSVFLALRS